MTTTPATETANQTLRLVHVEAVNGRRRYLDGTIVRETKTTIVCTAEGQTVTFAAKSGKQHGKQMLDEQYFVEPYALDAYRAAHA
jgi:hypothetical protein